jgi:hypothetical protein
MTKCLWSCMGTALDLTDAVRAQAYLHNAPRSHSGSAQRLRALQLTPAAAAHPLPARRRDLGANVATNRSTAVDDVIQAFLTAMGALKRHMTAADMVRQHRCMLVWSAVGLGHAWACQGLATCLQ